MVDVFISYSKRHAQLTKDLARDLEARGYTTWWDAGLLPGDEFPKEIAAKIDIAKAVVVIWSGSAVTSSWVQAEAQRADSQRKLITVRDPNLDPKQIQLPFNTRHTELVTDRDKIFAALARLGIAPNKDKQQSAPSLSQAGPIDRRIQVIVGSVTSDREIWLSPGESFCDLDISPEMVVVPRGEFWMGESGVRDADLVHRVMIPKAFAVGKYPVTFEEWDAYEKDGGGGDFIRKFFLGRANDRGFGRGRHPAGNIAWRDAKAYVSWLSDRTGKSYRLLSEAEWEYSCRAGTETAYSFGDTEDELGRYAWYEANSLGRPHPVGEKRPNKFGLHDMHGNVWEWCEDCWNVSYESKPKVLNQTGGPWSKEDCSQHVSRGGSWDNPARFLRSAYRNGDGPDRHWCQGFRIARTLSEATIA